MDGRPGFWRYNRKVKFIKRYKGEEVAESNDRLRHEGTIHIKNFKDKAIKG